jgi:hypothetical protein
MIKETSKDCDMTQKIVPSEELVFNLNLTIHSQLILTITLKKPNLRQKKFPLIKRKEKANMIIVKKRWLP